MSNCQKDIKLSKRCQIHKNMPQDAKLKKRCQMSNSQTFGLWKRFTKKNWHDEVHTYWHKFLLSNIKVTIVGQKYFLCIFWGFLVTIICDIKIDINICEPHYVNFFVKLLHSPCVKMFDIWHLFDNLTHYLNHLSLSQGVSLGGVKRYMWHVPTTCMLFNNAQI